MRTIAPITGLLLMLLPLVNGAQQSAAQQALPRTPAPDGAMAYFVSPADGDEVTSPFTVRFGLRNMGVAPAGVASPNTGHHHLLIDVEELPDPSMPLPNNDQFRHFGLGQTETELSLPAGQHTLQLVLGDALHIPHDPPVVSEKITITVK